MKISELTNVSRHYLWQNVAKLFNEATGHYLKKCGIELRKTLILSMTRSKKYKAACAKTGGGIGAEQPKNKYGDEEDIDLQDLDPTNTKFDSLIRPDLRIDSH